MENSFKSIIDKSGSVLILLPTEPYFDQVAAGLSLYLSLRSTKDVQIYSPNPMTVEFNRLIGVNKVTGELGDKNLIIRFIDYRAEDVDRVSCDIEDGQFKLTVVPKPSVPPPTKDQVEISYAGISADTVIMIGGANDSHFPALSSQELVGANIVHIGVRDITMSSDKNYISFARPASSVCEIVFELLSESQFPIDVDIATNLIMGIEEASQNFRSEGVTANTFFIMGELIRLGGRRLPPAPAPTAFPPGAIPGQFVAKPVQTPVARQDQKEPPSGSPQSQTEPLEGEQDQESDTGEIDEEEAPLDWLEPKIYKGTSIS